MRLCLWRRLFIFPYTSTITTLCHVDTSLLEDRSRPLPHTIRPSITQPHHSTNLATTTNHTAGMSAYGQHSRPQPQPQQNVLHVTSGDSSSSLSSSSSSSSSSFSSGHGSMHNIYSSPEVARCSRCHRTPSIDIQTGKSNMVQYGLNQYYCSRCAHMVGYFNR